MARRIVNTPYLQRIKGIWRVRVLVPIPLIPVVGKAVLLRSTGTRDKREANLRAVPIIAEFQAEITEAVRQLYGDDREHFYSQFEGVVFGEHILTFADEPPFDWSDYPLGFNQLIDYWEFRRGQTTQRARQAMEEKIKRLTDFLGHKDASKVTADDLSRYLRMLVALGLTPKTVDDHVAYLRRIFALAREAEWITTNPAAHLRRVSEPGRTKRQIASGVKSAISLATT